MNDPWRARQFGNGFTGEYLPTGEHNWRFVRAGGKPLVFRSRGEAANAAKAAFLERYEPPIRATIELSAGEIANKLAEKLAAEAEQFLKSNRQDYKNSEILHRAGKRPLRVLTGRAP